MAPGSTYRVELTDSNRGMAVTDTVRVVSGRDSGVGKLYAPMAKLGTA